MAYGSNPTRVSTQPIQTPRSQRLHDLRCLTSLPAGRMVPLAAVPILREESVTRGQCRVTFEMSETVEVLVNAINVRVLAYFVPHLAFERFDGMDSFNRSYMGIPEPGGSTVIPFFEKVAAPAPGIEGNEVLYYLGKHYRTGQMINMAYNEAYNTIWNFRAKNRSPDIAPRTRLDHTLAPAFWQHQNFAHIVPDFDQAVIDGEVALNVVNSKMPVKGMGFTGTVAAGAAITDVRESGSSAVTSYPVGYNVTDAAGVIDQPWKTHISARAAAGGFPDIWAELQDNGITVSLSNIDMARRTQAFAKLRKQYSGHTDEYIIDLLMAGIHIPDEAWKQPMLLSDRNTVFGMSKRYASDSGNLTESVVNGATFIDVSFTVPRNPIGGTVMILAEIAPEQLFERQKDPYLHIDTIEDLPEFIRDTLDPEKVEAVPNDYVDIDHDTPTATFGYAPLNYRWAKSGPSVGGRFYRPTVDAAFDEDRQRIWAVETQNPVLSEDFYLVTTMHYKPFVVTDVDIDPFEALTRGVISITGNTVFGGLLIEATDDYAKMVEEQPVDRIEKPVATAGSEGEE